MRKGVSLRREFHNHARRDEHYSGISVNVICQITMRFFVIFLIADIGEEGGRVAIASFIGRVRIYLNYIYSRFLTLLVFARVARIRRSVRDDKYRF